MLQDPISTPPQEPVKPGAPAPEPIVPDQPPGGTHEPGPGENPAPLPDEHDAEHQPDTD